MLIFPGKPLRSFVPAGPPACGIVGCVNQPIGGFEEFIESASVDPPSPLLPGLSLYWCRRHQFQLEARTVVKPGRRLSAEDVDALSGLS
ncbi:MAG TPA: hypothetical protein VFE06_02645 [Acidobacteriaceae bacterium]|nr:hypothetical protein [Acidobacteriaceae bacterium]